MSAEVLEQVDTRRMEGVFAADYEIGREVFEAMMADAADEKYGKLPIAEGVPSVAVVDEPRYRGNGINSLAA